MGVLRTCLGKTDGFSAANIAQGFHPAFRIDWILGPRLGSNLYHYHTEYVVEKIFFVFIEIDLSSKRAATACSMPAAPRIQDRGLSVQAPCEGQTGLESVTATDRVQN